MNVIIRQSELKAVMDKLSTIADKKSTIPILGNILLDAGDGKIRLTATDLDTTMIATLDCDVRLPGAICLPGKKLREVVASIVHAEIEISVSEYQAVIKAGRSHFKMMGMPKENFPEAKQAGKTSPIPAEVWRSGISKVSFAITNEESRYALNGARVEIAPKLIKFIATDGHRLNYCERKLADGPEAAEMLIPKPTLAALNKMLADRDGAVEFGITENHLHWAVPGYSLISRTLSGQFPDYRLVLPGDGWNNEACFPVASLLNAVRRVALMSDERSHAVRLIVRAGSIELSAQASESGEAQDVIECEYKGAEIAFGANAQYLIEAIAAIGDGDALLKMRDGNSQIKLCPKPDGAESAGRLILVIMPMRI